MDLAISEQNAVFQCHQLVQNQQNRDNDERDREDQDIARQNQENLDSSEQNQANQVNSEQSQADKSNFAWQNQVNSEQKQVNSEQNPLKQKLSVQNQMNQLNTDLVDDSEHTLVIDYNEDDDDDLDPRDLLIVEQEDEDEEEEEPTTEPEEESEKEPEEEPEKKPEKEAAPEPAPEPVASTSTATIAPKKRGRKPKRPFTPLVPIPVVEEEPGKPKKRRMNKEKPGSNHKGKKLRKYSIAMKVEIIEKCNEKGKRSVAREYGIDEKCIREWCKREAALRAQNEPNRARLPGCGRKPKPQNCIYSAKLIDYYNDLKKQNLDCTRPMMELEFERLQDEMKEEKPVKASGFVYRLLNNNKEIIKLDKVKKCKEPVDSNGSLLSFIKSIRQYRKKKQLDSGDIYFADKCTQLCLPQMDQLTSAKVQKFNVILTAKACGTKLPPLVVLKEVPFKALNLEKKFGFKSVHLGYSKDGSINEQIILQYVGSVVSGRFNKSNLLIWDNNKSHTTGEVKEKLADKDEPIKAIIVPSNRASKAVKPSEMYWNAVFKDRYTTQCQTWVNDPARLVPNVNATVDIAVEPAAKSAAKSARSLAARKAAREAAENANELVKMMRQVVRWIQVAWRDVNDRTIRQTFRVCGISNKLDGSEDGVIKCLQPKSMAVARDKLAQFTREQQQAEAEELVPNSLVETVMQVGQPPAVEGPLRLDAYRGELAQRLDTYRCEARRPEDNVAEIQLPGPSYMAGPSYLAGQSYLPGPSYLPGQSRLSGPQDIPRPSRHSGPLSLLGPINLSGAPNLPGPSHLSGFTRLPGLPNLPGPSNHPGHSNRSGPPNPPNLSAPSRLSGTSILPDLSNLPGPSHTPGPSHHQFYQHFAGPSHQQQMQQQQMQQQLHGHGQLSPVGQPQQQQQQPQQLTFPADINRIFATKSSNTYISQAIASASNSHSNMNQQSSFNECDIQSPNGQQKLA